MNECYVSYGNVRNGNAEVTWIAGDRNIPAIDGEEEKARQSRMGM